MYLCIYMYILCIYVHVHIFIFIHTTDGGGFKTIPPQMLLLDFHLNGFVLARHQQGWHHLVRCTPKARIYLYIYMSIYVISLSLSLSLYIHIYIYTHALKIPLLTLPPWARPRWPGFRRWVSAVRSRTAKPRRCAWPANVRAPGSTGGFNLGKGWGGCRKICLECLRH